MKAKCIVSTRLLQMPTWITGASIWQFLYEGQPDFPQQGTIHGIFLAYPSPVTAAMARARLAPMSIIALSPG